MSTAVNLFAFMAALVSMEGVAWAMHRYVMHGPLWALHRSHHEPRKGPFELNDLFGLVFAGLAVGLFWLGAQPGLRPLWWAAAGVSAYGFLYALVHDGLVHQRWPLRIAPRGRYLQRLYQAHRLHHAVGTREGAVSFGFLLPGDVRRLSAELKGLRGS
jgi:beta-carotene 3-hydroxylase